jgi:hypothetical protein
MTQGWKRGDEKSAGCSIFKITSQKDVHPMDQILGILGILLSVRDSQYDRPKESTKLVSNESKSSAGRNSHPRVCKEVLRVGRQPLQECRYFLLDDRVKLGYLGRRKEGIECSAMISPKIPVFENGKAPVGVHPGCH